MGGHDVSWNSSVADFYALNTLFRLRNESALSDVRPMPRAIVTSVPNSAHSNIYSHHVHVLLVHIGYFE